LRAAYYLLRTADHRSDKFATIYDRYEMRSAIRDLTVLINTIESNKRR